MQISCYKSNFILINIYFFEFEDIKTLTCLIEHLNNIQYDRYIVADPIFKLSQRSYHVQIWYAQRKQSELGSILSNFVVILNILASRRGWTRRGWTFRGWNFLRFWRKNEVPSGQRDRERQRERERVWSETQKWCKNCCFRSATLFLELKFTFSFITTFSTNKIDPKVIDFFSHHYNRYNKLSIVNFSLPKVP